MSSNNQGSLIRKIVAIVLLLASFVMIFFSGMEIYMNVLGVKIGADELMTEVGGGLDSTLEDESIPQDLRNSISRTLGTIKDGTITVPELIPISQTVLKLCSVVENASNTNASNSSNPFAVDTSDVISEFMQNVTKLRMEAMAMMTAACAVLLASAALLAHAVYCHLKEKKYNGYGYAICAALILIILLVVSAVGNKSINELADKIPMLGIAIDNIEVFHVSFLPYLIPVLALLSCAAWSLLPHETCAGSVSGAGAWTAGRKTAGGYGTIPTGENAYCPNCGAPLKAGSLFCPDCGSPIAGSPNPRSEGTKQEDTVDVRSVIYKDVPDTPYEPFPNPPAPPAPEAPAAPAAPSASGGPAPSVRINIRPHTDSGDGMPDRHFTQAGDL